MWTKTKYYKSIIKVFRALESDHENTDLQWVTGQRAVCQDVKSVQTLHFRDMEQPFQGHSGFTQ